MEREKIIAKLTDVFRDVFDNEELAITDATTADDIEEWDSLEERRRDDQHSLRTREKVLIKNGEQPRLFSDFLEEIL